jgi:hypothetical protein
MNVTDLDPVLLHDAVLAGLVLTTAERTALTETELRAVADAERERFAYQRLVAQGDPA